MFAFALLALAAGAAQAGPALPPALPSRGVAPPVAASSPAPGSLLPGREADARVATIAYRLATAGAARCPALQPATGLVLQHLLQFRPADRPGMVAALRLDRGPAVIAVVADSPAARAGLQAGDVLLAIGGQPLPPEAGLDQPFDAARAHARVDAVEALLAQTPDAEVTVLRDGATRVLRLAAVPACPLHVNLARSGQRNAYADGRHVFLTTALVALARSDDELAFIVAHEMAHNILGHAALMRSDRVAHGIGRGMGESGRIVRDTERQADRLGGELMLDAGYDPVAGASVLNRVEGGDLGVELFATHDPAGARIAAMRALATARARR